MAASQKAIDNSHRLRYTRALERFHHSIVSYLANTPDLSHESFEKKIQSAQKILTRVEEIQLYKGDLQDLQKFVHKVISLRASEKNIQEIKEEILYSSNQLDKSKNAKRYKKDKHTEDKFDDWKE